MLDNAIQKQIVGLFFLDIITVYENDDVEYLENGYWSAAMVSLSEINNPIFSNSIMCVCISKAITLGATKILRHILENGGNLSQVRLGAFKKGIKSPGKPLAPILDVMMAHGWDIDSVIDAGVGPLIQSVNANEELLMQCLNYDADVHKKSTHPNRARLSILEQIIDSEGSTALFDFFHSFGGLLGGSELHAACERTCRYYSQWDELGAFKDLSPVEFAQIWTKKVNQSMAMVHHLVDVIGLDVNAPRPASEGILPGMTPFGQVMDASSTKRDISELTSFLLDRGARLDVPAGGNYDDNLTIMEAAICYGETAFLDAVAAWNAKNKV